MRNEKRIPIVLKAFEKKDTLKKFLKPHVTNNFVIETILSHLDNLIKGYWLKNPDQRFGQLLINQGYIANSSLWFREEVDWLIDNKIVKARNILFWGKVYDKNMNMLPKTEWVLIKDMTKSHIKAILRDIKSGKMSCRLDYMILFKKELKLKNR